MGIISWILLGALAGWLASIVMGTNKNQGCLMDIVIGVVGAFVGGFIMSMITGADMVGGFDIVSILTAFGGAVLVLFVKSRFLGR